MQNFSHYIEDSLETPLYKLGKINSNNLYVKREDMIPYSFGGNKARKAFLFFEEIDKQNADCIVTYGSSHSNHCRVIANMAAERNIKCYIIAPREVSEETFNSRFVKLCGGEIIFVPVKQVHDTIEDLMTSLKSKGKKPYFIPGGGHGNIGTQAYVDCYTEIFLYEKSKKITFDYIFFASRTGSTHSGLVCGKILNSGTEKIIGISVARKNPYGRNVVLDSIKDYLNSIDRDIYSTIIEKEVNFLDSYIGDGYGKNSKEISDNINKIYIEYGMPLDSTYTGKAFYGMEKYILEHKIHSSNVLFIHTGGTPLFFNDMMEEVK